MTECNGNHELDDDGQRAFVEGFTSSDDAGHAWSNTMYYHNEIEQECYFCHAHRLIDRFDLHIIEMWGSDIARSEVKP